MSRIFSLLVVLAGASASAADKPNFIYFLIDDLGYSDVGFHGSEIKTPHIDSLAGGGAKLEAFYVQPVCSPTRAAFMTGRYPMRHGLQVGVVRPWAKYGLPLDERTLAQSLQENGYFTAVCGKWHLGHFERAYLPTNRGFTHQYGHYNGALDCFTHIRDGGFDWHRNDQVCRDEGYTTTLLGDEVVRLIEQADPARPFFIYVPFNAPHTPLQAPQEYIDRYASIADQKRRVYAAMVACIDDQIGRIVAALEKKGLRNNTLLAFSSDNGGPIGSGATNGSLRAGKATLYEGGVRVSAFANWPGQIKPGTVVTEPLHIVDWYPTLLGLAGAKVEQQLPLDGKDAWPTIAAGKPSPHEDILLNTTPSNGAIRAGNWKLVVNGGLADDGSQQAAGKAAAQGSDKLGSDKQGKGKKGKAKAQGNSVELFDLASDPRERTNLAEQQPDKVRDLRARLAKYQSQAVPPKSSPAAPDFKAPAVWGE